MSTAETLLVVGTFAAFFVNWALEVAAPDARDWLEAQIRDIIE